MANIVSQFPSILQAKPNQSSQHTYEIRKYYLGNVLLVRSHMLKGTEQYSFISVTLSSRTEENLGGNHKCLHISIICYVICIVPPSWHKLKVGFMQGLRRGEDPPPVAVAGGQAQQQQRGCDSLMGSSLLLREPRCRWLHPAKRAPGSATEHTWLDLG